MCQCTTLPNIKRPHLTEEKTEPQGAVYPWLGSIWSLKLPDSFETRVSQRVFLPPQGHVDFYEGFRFVPVGGGAAPIQQTGFLETGHLSVQDCHAQRELSASLFLASRV